MEGEGMTRRRFAARAAGWMAMAAAGRGWARAFDLSLGNEIAAAVGRALNWLQARQAPEGHWAVAEAPALTALALTAAVREPAISPPGERPEWVRKGFAWLAAQAQPDGGIYHPKGGYNTYNTAIGMLALRAGGDPAHAALLRAGRRYLAGQQNDFGEKGKTDTAMDGGVGYGKSEPHADLSNTVWALQAMRETRDVERGQEQAADLDWDAAIRFLERCQHLRAVNPSEWVSDDPAHAGGFVYHPEASRAGDAVDGSGKKTLKAYGSMSSAGLLSYLYAELKPEDPRVQAVVGWLGRHYTLEENPGMGAQGLFYYYHTLAKALNARGGATLALADGREARWREELGAKLVSLQKSEGFWVNENNRWWENDPVLATAYTVLALKEVVAGTASSSVRQHRPPNQ